MAWESRNGRGAYYTRSRRCQGTVIREYIGFDETAKVIAKIDDIERQVRKEAGTTRATRRARPVPPTGCYPFECTFTSFPRRREPSSRRSRAGGNPVITRTPLDSRLRKLLHAKPMRW